MSGLVWLLCGVGKPWKEMCSVVGCLLPGGSGGVPHMGEASITLSTLRTTHQSEENVYRYP